MGDGVGDFFSNTVTSYSHHIPPQPGSDAFGFSAHVCLFIAHFRRGVGFVVIGNCPQRQKTKGLMRRDQISGKLSALMSGFINIAQ
jgi:hypothetical protein